MGFKRLIIFFSILLVLTILSIYLTDFTGNVVKRYEFEEAFVSRVIDGDTIETSLGTVRLLGINAPEKSEPYYNEAREYLKFYENKTVLLLRDKEDEDIYKRKLRYLFYDNSLINLEILEKGLSISYMTDNLDYEDKLLRAENYARDAELGLWEKSKDRCAFCIKLIALDYKNESFTLKNKCSFYCNLEGWYVRDEARNKFFLNEINASQEIKISSNRHVWNNDHDKFFLRDNKGKLVIFYFY